MKRIVPLCIVLLLALTGVWAQRVRMNFVQQQTRCASHVEDRAACYRDVVIEATSRLTFSDAYELFSRVAADTRQDCHDLAHVFGRATYARYRSLPASIDEQSFYVCANGFWHGFMTAFTWAHRDDTQAIRRLCTPRGSMPDFEKNCYHGVGIGSVGDPPDIVLWGDEQAIIAHAVGVCEAVAPTDFMRDECIGGVFHQITDSKLAEEFNLPPFDPRDPLVFCDRQQEAYLPMCAGQLAPRLHFFAAGNLMLVRDMVAAHIANQALRMHTVALAVTGLVNSISEEQFSEVLVVCETLDGEDREACVQGALAGYHLRGISSDRMAQLSELSEIVLSR